MVPSLNFHLSHNTLSSFIITKLKKMKSRSFLSLKSKKVRMGMHVQLTISIEYINRL